MLKFTLLLTFFWGFFSLAGAELVFHFDFRGSAGKNALWDKTGKHKAVLETGNFVEDKGGLRIAPPARLWVEDTRKQKETSAMTVMAWVMKKGTPDAFPILCKGEVNGDMEFNFGLGYKYPALAIRNDSQASRKDYWSGIWYIGRGFGGGTRYAEKHWLKSEDSLFINRVKKHESSGEWHHVAATFDCGTVRIYVDGKLTAEKTGGEKEFLRPTPLPFCIGGMPLKGNRSFYQNADGLLNDLRFYAGALTRQEITEVIASEEKKYSKKHFNIPGCTHLDTLPPTGAYLPPDIGRQYDPWMEKTLPATAQFEKNRKKVLPQNFVAKPEIIQVKGLPQLRISGQFHGMAAITHRYGISSRAHHTRKYQMAFRNYAAAGINLNSLPIRCKDFWLGRDQYDFSSIDSCAKLALQAAPDSVFIVEILLEVPFWFIRQHPEELERSLERSRVIQEKAQSGPLGSELWEKEVGKMLDVLVWHIEKQSYGRRVIAYNPGGGESAEWYWPGAVYNRIPGFSAGTIKSFRNYLKKIYRNDAELQKAWGDNGVTLQTARGPERETWNKAAEGEFLTRPGSRRIIDFRKYMCYRTVLNQRSCAQAIKKACDNKKLVVIFSGYDLAVDASKIFHSGLSSAWEILNAPEIDMTASLLSYSKRRAGDHGLDVNPFTGSHRLAGKIHWQEDDPRTHLAFTTSAGASQSPTETLQVMKRSIAQTVVRNTPTWWRLFENSWFHENRIISTLQQGNKIIQSTKDADKSSTAGAAFIFDEKSHFVLSKKSPLAASCGTPLYAELKQAGVACDFYYQNDLFNPAMPDYKLYFFALSYQISEKERIAILQKLARNNAVAVWLYAPGYFDENYKADLKNMTNLTGFKFKMENQHREVISRPVKNNPLFAGGDRLYTVTHPLFFPENGEKIMTDSKGNTTFAVLKMPEWTSIYSLHSLTQKQIAAIYKYAGLHVYSQAPFYYWFSKEFIAVHARRKTSGAELKLNGRFHVKEMFSGKDYGPGRDRLILPLLEKGETLLFHLK